MYTWILVLCAHKSILLEGIKDNYVCPFLSLRGLPEGAIYFGIVALATAICICGLVLQTDNETDTSRRVCCTVQEKLQARV